MSDKSQIEKAIGARSTYLDGSPVGDGGPAGRLMTADELERRRAEMQEDTPPINGIVAVAVAEMEVKHGIRLKSLSVNSFETNDKTLTFEMLADVVIPRAEYNRLIGEGEEPKPQPEVDAG